MGWDFIAHETMKPLELLKEDLPSVTWVCTDGKARYKERETAWFGFAKGKDDKVFWVVALCQVRRDPEKSGGRRWVGYKAMDEGMGPCRKPPEKFWKDPRVAAVFNGQRSLFDAKPKPEPKPEEELKIGREDYEERQEERRDRYEAKSAKAMANYHALDKQADAAVAGIPFGQPILVGHHSEGRHRRALKRAQDKTFQAVDEAKKSEHYAGKAAGVGTGGISSDDPQAVVKLREKIAKAEELRESMKKLNRLYRKHKGDWEAIKATGEFSDGLVANAKQTMEICPYEKKPIPGYALTNLGANIRRMKKRIEHLLANARMEEAEPVEGKGYRIEEDKADNRIRFYFDEKPSKEVCKKMCQSGFKWSPRNVAWQRMLNPRARWTAEALVKEIFGEE